MTIQRIPIVTSTDPETFSSATITNGILPKNALFEKYPDGRIYATQRPPLGFINVGTIPPSSIGRGLYYWQKVNRYLLVLGNTVYNGNYSTPLTGSLNSGNSRVYFAELGDYLVIIETDVGGSLSFGYYIDSATPNVIHDILDPNFPGNLPGIELAGGIVTLDGCFYVMDTDKVIYNSASYDPTSWNALDFIKAERSPDQGVFICKHYDNIVAVGQQSLEFFYDTANPVGSPLSRRDDLYYTSGAFDTDCVFSFENKVYFMGSGLYGGLELYQLDRFDLSKLAYSSLDRFFSRLVPSPKITLSGGTVNGHSLLFIKDITFGVGIGSSLTYDITAQLFCEFSSAQLNPGYDFAVVDSVQNNRSLSGANPRLMFSNGSVAEFAISTVMQDTYPSLPPTPIEFRVQTGEVDFGSTTLKFGNRLSVVGTTDSSASNASSILISWSDDHYKTWSTEHPILTGKNRSIPRIGSFRRRAHKIRYIGVDSLRVEGLEVDIRASRYA